jgi:hypothetical protein
MDRYIKKPVEDGYLIIDIETGEVFDWCATEEEADEELKRINTNHKGD